jgi:DNA-binding phage protein
VKGARPKKVDRVNCAFDAGDCGKICMAIGIALQKRNVSEVARASGTQRVTIHRAFKLTTAQRHLNSDVVAMLLIAGRFSPLGPRHTYLLLR